MSQQSLFDGSDLLARKSDPATSHEAAQRMVESGKLGEQQSVVLRALRTYFKNSGEMPTACELAEWAHLGQNAGDGQVIATRRLSDLRRMGLADNGEHRKCRVKGSMMQTWMPTCNS